jgi:hypothetical protein
MTNVNSMTNFQISNFKFWILDFDIDLSLEI